MAPCKSASALWIPFARCSATTNEYIFGRRATNSGMMLPAASSFISPTFALLRTKSALYIGWVVGLSLSVARTHHGEASDEPRERNHMPTKHHIDEGQYIHFRWIKVKPTLWCPRAPEPWNKPRGSSVSPALHVFRIVSTCCARLRLVWNGGRVGNAWPMQARERLLGSEEENQEGRGWKCVQLRKLYSLKDSSSRARLSASCSL